MKDLWIILVYCIWQLIMERSSYTVKHVIIWIVDSSCSFYYWKSVFVTNSIVAILYNEIIIMNINIKLVHLTIDYHGDQDSLDSLILLIPLVLLLHYKKSNEKSKSQFFQINLCGWNSIILHPIVIIGGPLTISRRHIWKFTICWVA